MKSDFLIALTQLAAERHLPREEVLQAIEVALASAFKKDSPVVGQNLSVKLNPNTGEVNVYALRTVVETVEDPPKEISLSDALIMKEDAALGDEVAESEPLPHNASRIAAQTAKQVVLQRLREAERERIYQEFTRHQEDIISGVVEQMDPGRTIILDIGRAHAVLLPHEQVPTERYKKGHRLKVYVLDVQRTAKGPEIVVSRSHKDMLKRLFEIEVPEVYNGVVEIKAIAREAGFRSKVAVTATQQGIDPVGSCIGIRGNRIQSIVNELQGEKIDVVAWEQDPKAFIAKALSPSETIHVALSTTDQTAIVVVPDRQLSLAIGKEGQNARLAARLTGWRLDIKGLTEWEELKVAHQAKVKEENRLAAIGEADGEAVAVTAPESVEESPAEEAPELEPVVAEVAEVPTELVQELDEEALQEEGELAPGLSVEELASFTIEEVAGDFDGEEEDEEDEEEEGEEGIPVASETVVLTPAAGKIRFAEDIIGDFRGGGRRNRKSRRSSGSVSRGPRRGGGR